MSRTYDLLALHTQPAPEQTSKYFGISIFVHTSLAVAALLVTVPAFEDLKKDVVVIELQTEIEKPIEQVQPITKTLAETKGEKVKPTVGSEAVVPVASSALLDSELDTVVKGPVATSKKSTAAVAKLKTHTESAVAKPAKVATTTVSKAGVPETLEDIAAEDLNFDSVLAAQPGKLGDDDLEDDFKKVDSSSVAAIQAQKTELDNDLKQVADEKDEALNALEDNNKASARAMEDALNAKRTKNAAVLAQLKAAEDAAKEKALKQQQELAKAAKAKTAGRGSADATGAGANSSGANEARAVASGDPNAVRSLDQLRQVPGNPKPQYSVEERMQRQQGLVAFHAYITKSGQPSMFRLAQSTGFRNLDGKTLAALKKWKFYPGQEGWVEIPFKWDIKGGVQELPTLLRRSRYGSN